MRKGEAELNNSRMANVSLGHCAIGLLYSARKNLQYGDFTVTPLGQTKLFPKEKGHAQRLPLYRRRLKAAIHSSRISQMLASDNSPTPRLLVIHC
jgi:hypothetical protein